MPALPAAPGSPTAPTYPGTLNAAERLEVQRYLSTRTDAVLARLNLPAARAKATEYKTYFADPAIVAWLAACNDAQWAQRVLLRSDALVNNEGTTAASSVSSGTAAGAPPNYQPPGANTP